MSRLENHSPGPNLTIGGRDYVLFVSQGQNLLFVLALARASVGLSEAYRHAMEQPPSGTGPNSSGKSSALGEMPYRRSGMQWSVSARSLGLI
jgi:hypothetical protein